MMQRDIAFLLRPADRGAARFALRFREFLTYFLASIIGLAVDAATLCFLVEIAGLTPVIGSVLGFLSGAFVVYDLSVRFAFRVRSVRDRRAELAVFVAVGIGGLIVTASVMWMAVHVWSLDYRIAKVLAAGLSFFFNYGCRKLLLFRSQ